MACNLTLRGNYNRVSDLLQQSTAGYIVYRPDSLRLSPVTDCAWCNNLRKACLKERILITPCPAEEKAVVRSGLV
ncbi:MAG: hypothetical protein ACOX1G_08155 [bacterium]|jgi:hypothetical protein